MILLKENWKDTFYMELKMFFVFWCYINQEHLKDLFISFSLSKTLKQVLSENKY